ncbi:MAG: hypothetical protein EPN82_03740 [Bacteroidetes bacterium]|nr:MAG: hypothetical protein EPN82_03740 [Bacteroidota bacterium]
MLRISVVFFIIVLSASPVFSQIEHVPVVHPVYDFLLHMETKGLLENFSLSSLPLQRQEIVNALIKISKYKSNLSDADYKSLQLYETEFEIVKRNNAVLFFSSTDSNPVLSSRFYGNDEKFFYHLKDSNYIVNVLPIGSFESIIGFEKSTKKDVIYGNLGVRIYGTLSNTFGYFIQASNGAVLSGSRELALHEVHKLQQNIKFADLNSDFDFAESHVVYQNGWFNAEIGRETRLLGAGISQRIYLSDNAAQFDAISVGAKFLNFKYKFTHGSLLAIPLAGPGLGVAANIPSKYVAIHRFAIKPKWGEIGFWENIIYSKRGIDLTYLNPLSFFKSLEHALKDRDNSMMGLDATLRPFDGIQFKGTYLLDDLRFEKIGTGSWGNKSAWNIGMIASLIPAIDFAIEYARVEPYTFTHFDSLNAMTNDSMLYGSYLFPNSDELSFNLYYWWGERYPIKLKIAYQRHGDNYKDSTGKLINVGGNPFQTNRFGIDSETVYFLDGKRVNTVDATIEAGYEIFRGFNLHLLYHLKSIDKTTTNAIRLILRFEDF